MIGVSHEARPSVVEETLWLPPTPRDRPAKPHPTPYTPRGHDNSVCCLPSVLKLPRAVPLPLRTSGRRQRNGFTGFLCCTAVQQYAQLYSSTLLVHTRYQVQYTWYTHRTFEVHRRLVDVAERLTLSVSLSARYVQQ